MQRDYKLTDKSLIFSDVAWGIKIFIRGHDTPRLSEGGTAEDPKEVQAKCLQNDVVKKHFRPIDTIINK